MLRRGTTFVLFVFWVLAACRPEPPLRGRHNVILLSIDTLRADHLGAYGYAKPTSPTIDHFAAQGIVFARPSAQAPSTLLSHAAIFTAQIPQHHGASHVRFLPLAESAVTLTEVLAAQGFATVSFNSGGQLDRAFGLGQGFEIYEKGPDPFEWAVQQSESWLTARAQRGDDRPFFLFLHTYEVHHPYTPSPQDFALFADPNYRGALPKGISVEWLERLNQRQRRPSPEDLAYIEAAYDGEIRSVDRGFGRLLEILRQRQLLESTVIVVTSDHGEEFEEHGRVGWHSHSLYEELLWVPLIFRLPDARFAGARPLQRVRSIDIAPTLLDLLGLPPQPSFDGRSLLPLMSPGGQLEELPAIAFRDNAQGEKFESLAFRRYKWNEGKLFDLEADPAEKTDLAANERATCDQLAAELRRRVEGRRALLPGQGVELEEETRERLRSLGYAAGEPEKEPR